MRRLISIILSISLALSTVFAGGTEIIDDGGGQFKIEVPVIAPVETIKVRRDLEENQSLFAEEAGAGVGYVAVELDTLPGELFLDGRRILVNSPGSIFTVRQGRHYISLFAVREVYITYRDETPEKFWQLAVPEGVPADRFSLMSSFEREAVKAGTRWITVDPDDTVEVRLSQRETATIYRRNATTAAITFFSVTAIIAAAMLGSVALLARD
ncbi:MAG: hypothetical protein ACUVUR_04535 [bacterium]